MTAEITPYTAEILPKPKWLRVTGGLSSGLFGKIKNIVPANKLVRSSYHTDEQAHDGRDFDNT
jgi:lipoate synthase